jgi:hypothetical protein
MYFYVKEVRTPHRDRRRLAWGRPFLNAHNP